MQWNTLRSIVSNKTHTSFLFLHNSSKESADVIWAFQKDGGTLSKDNSKFRLPTYVSYSLLISGAKTFPEGETCKLVHCQSLPHRLAVHNLEVLWDIQRDYIHVSDVVNAVQQAMRYRTCGTYHAGTGLAIKSDPLAECVRWKGYATEPTPDHIETYTCADPSRFLPDWNPTVAVLNELSLLEEKINA